MAQIPVSLPLAQQPASSDSLSTITLLPASRVLNNDIVVLTAAGTIAPAGANPVGSILGLAQHDSNSNYGGAATQAAAQGGPIYPAAASNPGLFPVTPAGTIVATVGPPVIVEINLTATTGFVSGGTQQAIIGTAVGLAVDASGAYLADPTATNKVAVVSGKPSGPQKGTVGDLGARVLIAFNSSALAIPQGH